VLTAISALRGKFPEREHDEVRAMLWIIAGLVIQMILLRPAGFSLAIGVLFALTARGFGRGPVWLSLVIGAVFAFLIWVIFSQALQSSLPAARSSSTCSRGGLHGHLCAARAGLVGALQPINLLHALDGVTIGTAVGVLPGIGPAQPVALLLPVTYSLDPGGSLIMFAGIYYGGMYGGSTTSILLNTPGEGASIITALEGNKMARAGRGGPALATSAIRSFVAGLLATLALALVAPWVVQFAYRWGRLIISL
jgi:hypothetical protein